MAQFIQTYAMSIFLLPKLVCMLMESIISSSGRANEGEDRIHWLKWSRLCSSKFSRDWVLGILCISIMPCFPNKLGGFFRILLPCFSESIKTGTLLIGIFWRHSWATDLTIHGEASLLCLSFFNGIYSGGEEWSVHQHLV